MKVKESTYHFLARKMGLTFNGIQENPTGPNLPLFTHPEYGTFAMNEDESLIEAIRRKEKQFTATTPKEPNERQTLETTAGTCPPHLTGLNTESCYPEKSKNEQKEARH